MTSTSGTGLLEIEKAVILAKNRIKKNTRSDQLLSWVGTYVFSREAHLLFSIIHTYAVRIEQNPRESQGALRHPLTIIIMLLAKERVNAKDCRPGSKLLLRFLRTSSVFSAVVV